MSAVRQSYESSLAPRRPVLSTSLPGLGPTRSFPTDFAEITRNPSRNPKPSTCPTLDRVHKIFLSPRSETLRAQGPLRIPQLAGGLPQVGKEQEPEMDGRS